MPHPNVVAQSSGLLTSSGLVKTGDGVLFSIQVQGAACAWQARDGLTIAGSVIAQIESGGTPTLPISFPAGVKFSTGLYLEEVSGTGGCIVTYT